MSKIDYTVYIPSYQRAKDVLTLKNFPMAIIVCCESDEAEYRKYNPDTELLVCPDKVQGNIARVRNWILRNSKTDYLVLIDDDVKNIGGFEHSKHIKLNIQDTERFLMSGFEMMEDLDTVLWGINVNRNKEFYDEYLPFSLTNVVLGSFMGIKRVPGLYFDERLPLKEDFDYSIQVFNNYRKVLRFNKYFHEALHVTNEGGCTTYRSYEREVEQLELLRRKWGSKIVSFDISKSLTPRVKIPIKGI